MAATPGTVARVRCRTSLHPQTTTTGTNLNVLMRQPMSLKDNASLQMAAVTRPMGPSLWAQATPAVALHTDVALASVHASLRLTALPRPGPASVPCRFPLLSQNQ